MISRIADWISSSLLASILVVRTESAGLTRSLRAERARGNELERRLQKVEAEAVRLEREHAILRGHLRSIVAGAEEPLWVAAKALGEVADGAAPEAIA